MSTFTASVIWSLSEEIFTNKHLGAETDTAGMNQTWVQSNEVKEY